MVFKLGHKGYKSLLGKKLSEEHKRKIGVAMKGKHVNLGIPKTPKHKIKIGLANSIALKGRKLSKEHIARISGANHHSWQGGKSFEPYTIDWTETLKKSIREKYHYMCQICGNYGIIVHHIDYNKKNCDMKNLIVLCNKCHAKTNYNRKEWLKFFDTP